MELQVRASYEYEKNLLKKAEEFLNQKKDFSKKRDEYEIYIEDMSAKELLTSEEEKYLNKIMIMERRLKLDIVINGRY